MHLIFQTLVPRERVPDSCWEADRGCASVKDLGGNRGACRWRQATARVGRAFSGTTDPGADC